MQRVSVDERAAAERWFRDPSWEDADQAEFERRLADVRPFRRAQCLRLKALALREAGRPGDALTLARRVAGLDCVDDVERAAAAELVGDLLRGLGDPLGAEATYTELLGCWPDAPGTSGMVRVSLAELLLARGAEADLGEAGRLLHDVLDERGVLPAADRFRWYVCVTRLAVADGDHDTAREVAGQALHLLAQGTASPPDSATLDLLRAC